MKLIKDLKFGFRDAENYRHNEYKDLFNKIFIRTDQLDKLCLSNIYFLLGEKGTGKTALAMYMNNTEYKNNSTRISYLRETEYQKFITLKKEYHLGLSDYSSIWKVIIYLLIAQKICEEEDEIIFTPVFSKFKALQKAIEEYYNSAFSPEIIYAISFVEESKNSAELLAKYFKLQGDEKNHVSFSESKFQINLLYIKKQFENALRSVKLKKNHLLFIDGIDIRPRNVPYEDYLECIKGLTNAIWEVNTDFFSSIKDSKGRMRVVLLMRPDIFANLGLQNMNNKFRDNSVMLDWKTSYPNYRMSSIFELVDKLLESQQDYRFPLGVCWDHYFPYQIKYLNHTKAPDNSFIGFLRLSLYRPRDIISMLELLQDNFIQNRIKSYDVFNLSDFNNLTFQSKYSDYRLGEIKDHLFFYYSEEDYSLFLRFFTYLNGNFQFDYEFYLNSFSELSNFIKINKLITPIFCETADTFLQFLYDSNVICYIEYAQNEVFIRWCFRERDYSNISPKVKTKVTYRIHYGLSKALNVGKTIK